MFIVTGVMCAGRRRFRFNKYMFPFIDCVIRIYADSGGPIPISSIIECMKEHHGIRGVRNIYEGRDAAVDNGYIIEVHVKGNRGYTSKRYYYVPTLIGTIDAGIYQALLNSGIESSPETVHTFLRLMRFIVYWDAVSRYVNAALILLTRKLAAHLNCGSCLSQGEGKCAKYHICESVVIKIAFWSLRLFYGAVIAKAIAGVEVKDLKPKELAGVMMEAYTIATEYVEILRSDNYFYSLLLETLKEGYIERSLFEDMVNSFMKRRRAARNAAFYVTHQLVMNINKPVTDTTVNSEGKQRRLRR